MSMSQEIKMLIQNFSDLTTFFRCQFWDFYLKKVEGFAHNMSDPKIAGKVIVQMTYSQQKD